MRQAQGLPLGEAGAIAEYASLLADPAYSGVGLARGHGQPVVVLPGLFGGDFYLGPLRAWLLRLGYRPVRSSLLVNVGCPDRLTKQVRAQIERETRGAPSLAIIGHSRGGILAWALAAELGSRVSHLVLVGTPAVPAGVAARPAQHQAVPSAVRYAAQRSRELLDPDCDFPACACAFVAALAKGPAPATRCYAIASEDDALVPSAAAHRRGCEVHTVRGTHSGLVVNAAVYRLLATILATPAASGERGL